MQAMGSMVDCVETSCYGKEFPPVGFRRGSGKDSSVLFCGVRVQPKPS